jgi:ribA/ribD-fused uncharacterized protein
MVAHGLKGARITDDFIFFYGSCFSQWYIADIVVDRVLYNCNEQYMMAEKARLFNDAESEDAIMDTSDPKEQKALGKLVKDFDKVKWEKVCREVVFLGNYAKFTQDDICHEALIESGTRIIVEASPYDRIWGVGLGQDDPLVLDPDNWKGTNWLGEAIMQVRYYVVNDKPCEPKDIEYMRTNIWNREDK